MERWMIVCILVCTYGFLKTLRLSEPYDVQYLIQEKNITKEQIIHEAYPIATYTWFCILPFTFTMTSYLNYKPIIYVEAISISMVFAIMIWGNGLAALMVTEAFYGVSVAAEVAYLTYIYAKVEKTYYHRVTSYIHSATFVGTLSSALISQLLVSYNLMSLKELHYISLASALAAFLLSIFLPEVKSTNSQVFKLPQLKVLLKDFMKFGKELTWSYNQSSVLIYSIWWSIEKAGNYQVVTYYKSLVQEKAEQLDQDEIYTGAVQAAQCVLSVSFSIGLAYCPIDWSKFGRMFLCLVSTLQGLSLLGIALSNSIVTVYILLVIYRVLHQVTVTITSSEVAKCVNESTRGFIFGLNVFIAAGIQVILTLTVSSKTGLSLDIITQFLVYSGFNLILGFAYFIFAIVYVFKTNEQKSII